MRTSVARLSAVLAGVLLATLPVRAATPGSATYTYDGLGRLVLVTYEGGANGQVYAYDKAGNRQTSYSGPMPVLGITASAGVVEGNTVTLTVTRTNQAAVATSVSYQTVDGTAIAGTNYTATSGTLNFLATDTAKSFSVATLNDGRYDGSLNFTVKITAASGAIAALTPSSALVTMTDASPAPVFAVATPSPTLEGNTATLTVTRSGTTSLTQTVSYATSNGSAVAGTDYTSESGGLSFAPNVTSQTFAVPTIDRAAYEGTRSFNAVLSNPGNGAVIGTPSTAASITDGDTAIAFSINSPGTVAAGTSITFNVTEAGGPPGIPFSINYATVNGSAVAGTDYTATSGVLNFPVGTTSQPVTVTTSAPHADNNVRTFTLALSNATNGAPITTASGTGSIQSSALPPAPVLTPPTRFSTNGSYSLVWTVAGGNPTSFQLWTWSDNNPTHTLLYNGPGGTYASSVTTSQTYDFQVEACNANGCGPFSNTAVVNVCIPGRC